MNSNPNGGDSAPKRKPRRLTRHQFKTQLTRLVYRGIESDIPKEELIGIIDLTKHALTSVVIAVRAKARADSRKN